MENDKNYCLYLNNKYNAQLKEIGETLKLHSFIRLSENMESVDHQKNYFAGYFSEEELILIYAHWVYEVLMVPDDFEIVRNLVDAFLSKSISSHVI